MLAHNFQSVLDQRDEKTPQVVVQNRGREITAVKTSASEPETQAK